MLRTAVALAVLAATGSALADPMNAETARRFVVGKTFAFTCFEGTAGTGRIFSDGSVAGVVKIQGSGPTRFMHLPPGTLFTKGEAVCSSMKGAFFNPCFNLNRTSDKSFRGTVSGFGFMYCDFTRGGREMRTASATEGDPTMTATPRRSIRHGRAREAASAPAVSAAPVQPVTAEPLKPAASPAEQPALRSTVSE
ncbi:MAG: hypothetical protein QOG38_2918 [Hyphomicrobiales bacterium]|jgi:hypothetical protein|nr:hypothetical protein [Hyphomicrobiales bacterium]